MTHTVNFGPHHFDWKHIRKWYLIVCKSRKNEVTKNFKTDLKKMLTTILRICSVSEICYAMTHKHTVYAVIILCSVSVLLPSFRLLVFFSCLTFIHQNPYFHTGLHPRIDYLQIYITNAVIKTYSQLPCTWILTIVLFELITFVRRLWIY